MLYKSAELCDLVYTRMEAANMRQSAPQCFQVATVLGLLLLVAPFTATRPSATNQGTKQVSYISRSPPHLLTYWLILLLLVVISNFTGLLSAR